MHKFKDSKFYFVLNNQENVLIAFISGCVFLITTGFQISFLLIATTSNNYKGMGFNANLFAVILLVEAFISSLLQLSPVSKLGSFAGPKTMLLIINIVLIFVMPSIPAISLLVDTQPYMFWVLLAIIYSFVRLCVYSQSISINISVANFSSEDLLDATYDMVSGFSMIGGAASSIVVGFLYSWSLSNVTDVDQSGHRPLGLPFDTFFVF